MSQPDADPDALTSEERAINRAAWRTEIQRGTSAYYEALRDFGIPELIEQVSRLVAPPERPPGVSEEAWAQANAKGLAATKVFAYPDLLRAHPRLVGYYRRLVGASTKAVRNVIADPKPYETGKRSSLGSDTAAALADLFNSAMSRLLEEHIEFSEADIPALVGATSGSQVQGTIVTVKGQLAQEEIWSWILGFLSNGGFIDSLLPRGPALPTEVDLADPAQVQPIASAVRTCKLGNSTEVTIGSEPDLAVRDSTGLLLAVHEVKAGIDFAGAKERYPAAQRSFQEARRENPACHTVLVAGCLSAAVKKMIRTGGWVNRSYLLPELQMNEVSRYEYLNREIGGYAVR